jgi:alpha-L-arabinofuranosidase
VAGDVQVFTVTGENEMVSNMFGKQEVSLQESKWEGKGKFAFGKHSLTILRWKSG